MTHCAILPMLDDDEREFALGDYEGAVARWCPGCGDHSVLTAVEKLLVAEQLKPEQYRVRVRHWMLEPIPPLPQDLTASTDYTGARYRSPPE